MDVLHGAPDLLQRYKHGDAFRHYVHRHLPQIVAALIVFLSVSTASTAAMAVYFGGTNGLVVLACLVVAPFVLVGSLFVQVFMFFSWLERRAIDLDSGRRPRSIQEHLPEVPWTLAGVFLVLPFFILALVSIKIAATLLVVVILTPFVYQLFDGE